MVTMQVPNFCTITEVCQRLGFTYYTVAYWLEQGLVKWIPAGTKKLINMEDLNRFLNGEKGETTCLNLNHAHSAEGGRN